MSSASSDRNLLFGILSVHNGLIAREALLTAMTTWLNERHRPLGEILVASGAMSRLDRELLEQFVERHVAQHGGDAEQSLRTISPVGSVREDLLRLKDAEVLASLAKVSLAGLDIDACDLPTVAGQPTSAAGRFRILRMHGQGGMGRVHLAEDSELPREVALKEIMPEFASDPVLRQRFQLEAEVTGGLEHPGIVPVYGLGAFDDGRPFYVMRFIRGDSLKEAIAQFHAADRIPRRNRTKRSLALRDLLQRFLDVCDAVEYANQRGVLHRDLKPGNVMVGRYGETLVVDWGVAKVIGRDETATGPEKTLHPPSAVGSELTMQGAVGTLQYMSPEQAQHRADLLGIRSDVFCLGATLYHLLTGTAPRTSTGRDELESQARRGEYVPVRKANPRVPAALVAVCEKALQAAPENRYPSARTLADDVKHWLADEPVSAYREPLTKRAGRWARRHRTLVTSSAATLLVAVLGLGIILVMDAVQNRKLQEADARLFQESKKLIDSWFTEVSESRELRDAPGLQPLRRKLLKRAKTYYEQAAKEQGGSIEVLADTADANMSLGTIDYEIGSKDEALAAFEKAREIRERLVREKPSNIEYQRDLAHSHNNIGLVLRQTGQMGKALAAHKRARGIQEKLVSEKPSAPQFRSDLAASHLNIGQVLGHTDEALAAYEEAREIQEKLVDENPSNTEFRSELAQSHTSIGLVHSENGRTDEAQAAFKKALDIQEMLVHEYPSHIEYRSELAGIHNNMGDLLKGAGQTDEALANFEKACEIQELVNENPIVTEYRVILATALYNIGVVHAEADRTDDALAAFERAREIQEKLKREHPSVTEFASKLAEFYHFLGSFYCERDRRDDALANYRRAADNYRTLPDNQSIYQLACVESQSSTLVGVDADLDQDEVSQREKHVDAAMVALREAVDHGYKDVQQIESDEDLAPLRERADFQELVAKLKLPSQVSKSPQSKPEPSADSSSP